MLTNIVVSSPVNMNNYSTFSVRWLGALNDLRHLKLLDAVIIIISIREYYQC